MEDFLLLFIVTSCRVKIADRGRSSPKKCSMKINIPYKLLQFAQLWHYNFFINCLSSINSITSKTILMMKLKAKIEFAIVMVFVRDVPRPNLAIVYFLSLIVLKMIAAKMMVDAVMAYFKFCFCLYLI